ncbi:uncharacterized protein LOC125028805 [Penaeus chinensis]|uniref:uncharacterized protein LOC125028805 n=1 Tax=Penaeus chinensis TaxID=139456 RepID=UPI001FB59336|nr:uncharacterized protein LOC125028805 [Penaeus chinensis]
MSAITLCAWLRFRHFMPVVDKIVSYFTVGDEDIKIYYDFINKEFVIWTPGYRLTINIVIPLYTWTHIFMTFDLITTENYVLVNNAEVEGEVSLNNEKKVGSNLAAGGLLVLGQDQDSLGGGYAITQAFSGDMAQLLMYSKFFSRQDRRQFNCFENRLGLEKPILSTSVLEDWNFVGDVESQQMPRHLISPSQKVNFFVLPENEYFSDAAKMCRVLGLPLALPKSEEQNEELFIMAVSVESICITAYSTNVWLGVRANFTTMSWENANNYGRLSYQNFDPLYSTLSETDQCVSLGSSHYPRVWHKTSCQKYKPCPACENAPVNSIQVRGLCLQSNFDRRLHIHGTKNLKPMFHGTFYTRLWWDNSTWVMASRLLPSLEARMVIGHSEAYPIGLHRWHVSGDECPAQQLDLLLTVCGENSFPCSDGTCVLMSERCDLRAHCDDGSDETECDIVYLEANYERTLPPPPPEKEDVLNITLSIIITAVRTLNLLDQTVTLDVRLMSEWQDSRLKYNDLHSEQFRNQLQDHERLWLPRFITTDDTGSRVDVVTRGESLVVLRGSEPLPSDDTRVKKAIVYPGSGNPLLLRQELSISFQCQFDLRWFPFDNQRCSLNLRLNEVESKLVHTVASEPQYLGPEKLPEYEVGSLGFLLFVKWTRKAAVCLGEYSGSKASQK